MRTDIYIFISFSAHRAEGGLPQIDDPYTMVPVIAAGEDQCPFQSTVAQHPPVQSDHSWCVEGGLPEMIPVLSSSVEGEMYPPLASSVWWSAFFYAREKNDFHSRTSRGREPIFNNDVLSSVRNALPRDLVVSHDLVSN
jgi:hypothetical protein